MPFPKRLTFTGNIAHIYQDDGSQLTFYPTTENQWVNRTPAPTYSGSGGGSSGGPTVGITAAMVEAAVNSAGSPLSSMVGTSAAIASSFMDAIAAVAPGILTNKKRAACLVGECAQETDWYKTTTEYGAGGNTYSPYDGRGFIQLTWRDNYAGFGRWMESHGLLTNPNYFVDNPTRLADLKWAPYTAIYYFTVPVWDGKNLFEWCDNSSDPWSDISRAINRGSPTASSAAYGEAARAAAINAALGAAPEPSGGGSADATAKRTAVASWMTSHLDAFGYSQNLQKRRDPVTYGVTDCSALINYCYETQIDMHIGWWGGSHDDGMQQYGRLVIPNTTSSTPDESLMRVGDVVFFNWDGPSKDYDHVEMYVGNNQVCGHGGPDPGPDMGSLSGKCSYAYSWCVRRYIED